VADNFERFSLAISELYHYLHKITRDEMEEYGLGGPHAIYFFILLRHKEGMTSAELSEASFRNKADVSRAVAFLEKKGLVVKKDDAHNNYRAKITLTDKGIDAATKLRKRAKIVNELVSNGLTEEKRDILYEALGLISSNMKEVCNEKGSEHTK